jgi:hypothetical protein
MDDTLKNILLAVTSAGAVNILAFTLQAWVAKMKTPAEVKKIEADASGTAMTGMAAASKTMSETAETLLRTLATRVGDLEKDVKDRNIKITELEVQLVERDRKYNRKISKILEAIRVAVEDRARLTSQTECPHLCMSVDIQLQGTIASILANGTNGTTPASSP